MEIAAPTQTPRKIINHTRGAVAVAITIAIAIAIAFAFASYNASLKQSTIFQPRRIQTSATARSFAAIQRKITENVMQLTPFCSTWLSQPETWASLSFLPSCSPPRCPLSRYSVFAPSYWVARCGLTSLKVIVRRLTLTCSL
jgi:hypothetical protein